MSFPRAAPAPQPRTPDSHERNEGFNRSGLSRFINSPAGRFFRLAAGTGFLVLGYLYREHPLGLASMAWSVLPLSAGAFDLCYVSAVLGGPLRGDRICRAQADAPSGPPP